MGKNRTLSLATCFLLLLVGFLGVGCGKMDVKYRDGNLALSTRDYPYQVCGDLDPYGSSVNCVPELHTDSGERVCLETSDSNYNNFVFNQVLGLTQSVCVDGTDPVQRTSNGLFFKVNFVRML